jgi:hypothetical protein
MFRRTIAIVDLASGRITERPRETLTLDVPADFDRSACIASVDAHSRASYLSTSGTTLVNPAHPRPLSWRVHGEECLVARARGTADRVAYRLCAVAPASG